MAATSSSDTLDTSTTHHHHRYAIHFDSSPPPDHLYLSPSFYSSSLKCVNNNNSSPKMLVSSGKTIGQSVLLSNEKSASVFALKSSTEYGGDDSDSVDFSDGSHHHHRLLGKNSFSRAHSSTFTDDDDDSNDTKSCSSSSGCSSSSNSMVGSVNRHLTINNNHHRVLVTSANKNTTTSVSQYKDLTPKQVKRRLDWDSTTVAAASPAAVVAPESTSLVSKTTMTAVNGKPVSVRRFKLSNAMKQSLVASGCSKAVAVAAFAAACNGNHEKLIATASTSLAEPVPNQSTIAIVNGSPKPAPSPTTTTPSNQSAIFKTPLAPKSSPPPPPTTTTSINSHVIILNGNDVSTLDSKTNGSAAGGGGIRFTPILASTVQDSVAHKTNGFAIATKGVKRVRTAPVNGNIQHDYSPKYANVLIRNHHSDEAPVSSIYSSPYSGIDLGSISPSHSYCSLASPSGPPHSTTTGRKSGRTRQETSLGQLTRKFISLLEKSADGSINLNEASDFLQVQKRRIYDITNVLEGVGLLHKTSKNNIQWRGGLFDYCGGKLAANQSTTTNPAQQTAHYRNRKPPPLSLLFGENQNEPETESPSSGFRPRDELEQELLSLENDENRIDDLIEFACDDLNRVKADASTLLYANYMDLRRVPEFKDQTVIGIRPPMDTTLEVSDPSESLQIWLKNSRGEMIEVYLCPQNFEEEDSLKSLSEKTQEQQQPVVAIKSPVVETNSVSDELSESKNATSEIESGYNSYFGNSSNSALMKPAAKEVTTTMATASLVKSHPLSPTSFTGIDIDNSLLSSSSLYDDFSSRVIKSEPLSENSDSRYAHAFISQDDEFGPLGSRTYLTQTEDQYTLKSSTTASSHQTSIQSSQFASSSQHHHHHNSHHHSPTSSPITSLIPLEPPVTDDDYNFTLCESEGIVALFDDDFDF